MINELTPFEEIRNGKLVKIVRIDTLMYELTFIINRVTEIVFCSVDDRNGIPLLHVGKDDRVYSIGPIHSITEAVMTIARLNQEISSEEKTKADSR